MWPVEIESRKFLADVRKLSLLGVLCELGGELTVQANILWAGDVLLFKSEKETIIDNCLLILMPK